MIKLIEPQERLVYKVDADTEIHYRRPTMNERQYAINKHTRRGNTDWWAVGIELLKSHVLGWQGFLLEGKQVEFDPKYIDVIPDEILTGLFEVMRASEGEELVEKK